MDTAKYLRDRAAEFANRAVTTADAVEAQNLHELSILCRESAERLDRRLKATKSDAVAR
ncbi:MAG TPA: hypothetical protein VN668_20630 [Stellaceae bacterium]|nr:hypothetical protein [Stellaceae bacterium]